MDSGRVKACGSEHPHFDDSDVFAVALSSRNRLPERCPIILNPVLVDVAGVGDCGIYLTVDQRDGIRGAALACRDNDTGKPLKHAEAAQFISRAALAEQAVAVLGEKRLPTSGPGGRGQPKPDRAERSGRTVDKARTDPMDIGTPASAPARHQAEDRRLNPGEPRERCGKGYCLRDRAVARTSNTGD